MGRGSRTARLLAATALALGLAGCAFLTWRVSNLGASGVNLVPGATVLPQLQALVYGPGRGIAGFNLVGNLFFLVPAGILTRALTGWRVWVVGLAGLVVATVPEVGQAFVGRSVDIDDVLVNTLGAALGAGLAALAARRRTEGSVGVTSSHGEAQRP